MILPIDDEHRIASDAHSWSVQVLSKRKRNGNDVVEWKSIAWYSSFEHAVAGLGERMLRLSDAVGIQEALGDIERVCAALSAALPTHLRVANVSELPSRVAAGDSLVSRHVEESL